MAPEDTARGGVSESGEAGPTDITSVSSVLASAERSAGRSARRTRRRRRAAVGSASLVMVGAAVVAVVVVAGWPAGDDHSELSSSDASSDETIALEKTPPEPEPDSEAGPEPAPGPEPGVEPDVPPPGTDDDTENGRSSWSAISPDPAGVRVSPQTVWTGAEAIAVYGTDASGAPRTDLSSYIPATGTWREISRPPIDGPMAEQHTDPLVMWTGSEMLMIGGRAGADVGRAVAFGAVAFEPHQGTWRTTTAPGGFVDTTTPWAWSGDELLVWSNVGPEAFDPATDTWRDLADPPVPDRSHAASVWSGAEWIVWGGSRFGDSLADGAAYDPSTDTWRPIANGFGHPGFVPVWTGSHLVMFAKGSAVVYDPAADVWLDHCCNESGGVPGGTPVWTGTSIVAIGSSSPDAGGSVFVVRHDPSGEPTIPIEIAVDRPDLTSIRSITVRIPDDAFEMPFTSRTTDPGAAADLSREFPVINSWVAASCGCQLGIAVVEDFGDDAPLYGYLADTERITSSVGEWMLMVGEQPGEPTVAFLRVDGILIQASIVEGTQADLRAVIDSIQTHHT